MTLTEKQKVKTRRFIRLIMVFIAVVLLFFAVGIPMVNNAMALHIENELKALPLPEDTVFVESISQAGRFVGNGNGMQYFGAILIQSDRYPDELLDFYQEYDCFVTSQPVAEILTTGGELSFRHTGYDSSYYIVYRWGGAPVWLQDLLDTDLRGH